MNQSIVRCRCGHQVLGREVLRTEPFEKSSGREVVYVKYRCRRCKSMGEAFIPHDEWNPGIFDTPRNEMETFERDKFIDQKTISSGDVISFHRALKKTNTLAELTRIDLRRKDKKADKSRTRDGDRRDGDKPQNGRSSPSPRPNG